MLNYNDFHISKIPSTGNEQHTLIALKNAIEKKLAQSPFNLKLKSYFLTIN